MVLNAWKARGVPDSVTFLHPRPDDGGQTPFKMRTMPARLPLVLIPTPCHRLDRLSDRLGIDLWIKRDDLTGFAAGGNKGRKLEFLMAEALASGADVVVSCGSVQSNFVRQLGAACRVLGMDCAAAVMHLPYEPDCGKPSGIVLAGGGNEVLDRILGVEMRFVADGSWEDLFVSAEELAQEKEREGKRVYRIPIGGSSPLGAYSFYLAGLEAMEQGEFDVVVTPSSSGSTHAGLAYAFAGTPTRVVGISCDPEPENLEDLVRLTAGLDELTGLSRRMGREDFDLRFDYVGAGYGVPSEAGDAALEIMARTEGIFLDPVYSAKAFSGLLDLANRGELGARVLFWHTGGLPSLFAERHPV